MKKLVSLLTALVMLCSCLCAAGAIYADEDTAPPQIDYSTLSVTLPAGKSTVGIGDTVTISVKVSDESALDYVQFSYFSATDDQKDWIASDYNSETQTAVYNLTIDSSIESGTWKLYLIGAVDVYNNEYGVFNSNKVDTAPEGYPNVDLSAGDFTVDEPETPTPQTDKNPPVIDDTSVAITLPEGKTDVTTGDAVRFAVSATDDTAIDVIIVHYYYKATNSYQAYELSYNNVSGKYEGDIIIGENVVGGKAVISKIYARDTLNNSIELYNSALYDAENKADLSAGNFSVVHSVASATVSPLGSFRYDTRLIKPKVFITDNGYTLTEGKDYTLSYKNNLKGPTATVIITGIGDYSGEKTVTFTIYGVPVPVSKPKTTSIKKLIAGKKCFTVKWTKISGIKGYQIQYSTSKKFKKAKTKTVVGKSKAKATVKKLKKGTKYFVRMRNYKVVNNKKFYSKWSRVKSVTTKK